MKKRNKEMLVCFRNKDGQKSATLWPVIFPPPAGCSRAGMQEPRYEGAPLPRRASAPPPGAAAVAGSAPPHPLSNSAQVGQAPPPDAPRCSPRRGMGPPPAPAPPPPHHAGARPPRRHGPCPPSSGSAGRSRCSFRPAPRLRTPSAGRAGFPLAWLRALSPWPLFDWSERSSAALSGSRPLSGCRQAKSREKGFWTTSACS